MIPDIALDQCLCFIMGQYKMKVNEIVVLFGIEVMGLMRPYS